MSGKMAKMVNLDPPVVRAAVIGAHLFALVAYLLGLGFLFWTNGGSLFLFSTVAPISAALGTLAIAGVSVYRFVRRQSLFAFAVFEPGDLICVQGDEGDWAYFIQSGEVEVVRKEDNVEHVIARLSKGHHFGEAALISNTPHYVTVRAATRVRVAALGRRNFLSILRYAPFTQQDVLQSLDQRAFKQAERHARQKARRPKEN